MTSFHQACKSGFGIICRNDKGKVKDGRAAPMVVLDDRTTGSDFREPTQVIVETYSSSTLLKAFEFEQDIELGHSQ
ncbi:hypothetical protein SADUNF_Sadunf03G0046100 [Salix dunnii]|uniref:Uncharacterized protein n=1 Tax=Salix dunnii TaxID=1413687 RepID=A0A835N392_9ROSI|nr:hypothetical protein SADUNF_Sadunf03G0046100 [Salix dunnii]